MTVRIGQVWADKDKRGTTEVTLTITSFDDRFVRGIRSPHGKTSTVRRGGDGVKGYVLMRDVEES